MVKSIFNCTTKTMECPKCSSIPGKVCRSPSGRKCTNPHKARIILYCDSMPWKRFVRKHTAQVGY